MNCMNWIPVKGYTVALIGGEAIVLKLGDQYERALEPIAWRSFAVATDLIDAKKIADALNEQLAAKETPV